MGVGSKGKEKDRYGSGVGSSDMAPILHLSSPNPTLTPLLLCILGRQSLK